MAEEAETFEMGTGAWDSYMCVGELCRDEVGRGRGEGGRLITASYVSGQGPAHNNMGLRANH